MIVFIVVPNNKSLAGYLETALKEMGNPPKERIMVSRGEDVPFIVEELSKKEKKAILKVLL